MLENPIQKVVLKEQTLPSQETTPLKRSTRERKSVMPNDYILFLKKYKADIGVMEDNPINSRQVIESSNSQK